LSVICRHLSSFPKRDVLLPAMKLICQRLLKLFGQTSPLTLDVQEVYNFMLVSHGHYSVAETRARHLLTECEPSLGVGHEAVLQFRNQLALSLSKQEKFDLAEEAAYINLRNIGFSCDRLQHKDIFLFSLEFLYLGLLG